MAIKAVTKTETGYTIEIENKSNKPLPIDLTISYNDGSSEKIHYTIGVWENEPKTFISSIKTSKQMVKVVMKSDHVPDKNRSDNTFTVK